MEAATLRNATGHPVESPGSPTPPMGAPQRSYGFRPRLAGDGPVSIPTGVWIKHLSSVLIFLPGEHFPPVGRTLCTNVSTGIVAFPPLWAILTYVFILDYFNIRMGRAFARRWPGIRPSWPGKRRRFRDLPRTFTYWYLFRVEISIRAIYLALFSITIPEAPVEMARTRKILELIFCRRPQYYLATAILHACFRELHAISVSNYFPFSFLCQTSPHQLRW